MKPFLESFTDDIYHLGFKKWKIIMGLKQVVIELLYLFFIMIMVMI